MIADKPKIEGTLQQQKKTLNCATNQSDYSICGQLSYKKMSIMVSTRLLLNGLLLVALLSSIPLGIFTKHNLGKNGHNHHQSYAHLITSLDGGAEMELLNLTELHANLSRRNPIFFRRVPAGEVGKRLAKVTRTKGQKIFSYRPEKVS